MDGLVERKCSLVVHMLDMTEVGRWVGRSSLEIIRYEERISSEQYTWAETSRAGHVVYRSQEGRSVSIRLHLEDSRKSNQPSTIPCIIHTRNDR